MPAELTTTFARTSMLGPGQLIADAGAGDPVAVGDQVGHRRLVGGMGAVRGRGPDQGEDVPGVVGLCVVVLDAAGDVIDRPIPVRPA